MLVKVEKENMDHSEVEVIEDFGTGYFVPYQRALWDLFEKPQSSHSAKMISLLSTGIGTIKSQPFNHQNIHPKVLFSSLQWACVSTLFTGCRCLKTNDIVRNKMRSSAPQAHDVKGDPVDNPSLAFIEAVLTNEK